MTTDVATEPAGNGLESSIAPHLRSADAHPKHDETGMLRSALRG